jgi:uncharacterized protein (DUF4415 family)
MKTTTDNLLMTNTDGEVRELTSDDMKQFKPASEVLPDVVQGFKNVRGKQVSPTKIKTTVRFSPEVIEYFKSTGDGWQTRMDNVLKEYVASH